MRYFVVFVIISYNKKHYLVGEGMKKNIDGSCVSFYEDDKVLMYIDHSTDECIWVFNKSDITVTLEDELYSLIDDFMRNDYIFSDEVLVNYKDKNKLVWYSDCYYDPDDEWSKNSVSCLEIVKENNVFRIHCSKKIEDVLGRKFERYGICFSPLGNGKFSKNVRTNCSLQDEFVMNVYRPLLNRNITLCFK